MTTTITARPCTEAAELPAIAELINACDALDQLDQGTSPGELRSFFEDPETDRERDFRLWHDAEGRLLGCGQLFVDQSDGKVEGRLRIYVHPAARDGELGARIVGWGEQRMREIGRERGKPPRIRSLGRDDIPYRLDLVKRHGFMPERYFLRMARRLDGDLPEPQIPAGFSVRPLDGQREAVAWTELCNLAFRDHWNPSEYSLDEVRHWLADPSYRPELNLVAAAPDGRLAGFCWCSIKAEDGTPIEAREGWIDELGTHPAFRKIGLGRCLLLAGMHRLKALGIGTVKLGVDAHSRTGATRLYDSVGFEASYRQVTSAKDL
jgi:mycothiol synthase